MTPPVVFGNWNFNGGRAVAMSGGNTKANEIYVWEGNSLRQLTNARTTLCLLSSISASPKKSDFKSKDGTQVNGC
jgi:hypothetical protein